MPPEAIYICNEGGSKACSYRHTEEPPTCLDCECLCHEEAIIRRFNEARAKAREDARLVLNRHDGTWGTTNEQADAVVQEYLETMRKAGFYMELD